MVTMTTDYVCDGCGHIHGCGGKMLPVFPSREDCAAPEMLALLEESQRNLTGDWRERRDALLERLNGDEE